MQVRTPTAAHKTSADGHATGGSRGSHIGGVCDEDISDLELPWMSKPCERRRRSGVILCGLPACFLGTLPVILLGSVLRPDSGRQTPGPL